MNGKLSTALAAAAVLALAGCSSSTTSAASSTPTPSPTTSAQAGYLTMTQVAREAGCTDSYTPSSEVGTKDGGTCTVNGHEVYFYTFADDSARDNWLKAAKAASALGSFQQGSSWVIQSL